MQPDLFNYSSRQAIRETEEKTLKTFQLTLKLDQLVGVFIVFIIFYIFIYSLGVEKGQKLIREQIPYTPAIHDAMIDDGNHAVLEEDLRSFKAVSGDVIVEEDSDLPRKLQEKVAKARRESGKTLESDSETLQKESRQQEPGEKPEGKYTIQHVTYHKKSQAESEMKKLIEMGFHPFLIERGKYFQVCLNGFASYKTALNEMEQLKSRGVISIDAYIRNIPTP